MWHLQCSLTGSPDSARGMVGCLQQISGAGALAAYQSVLVRPYASGHLSTQALIKLLHQRIVQAAAVVLSATNSSRVLGLRAVPARAAC
jgi:hypothetical protein